MTGKLTVMVSSTVYGIEELLERIYTLLTAFGYEVWMSHKGTVPVFSNRSALENCLVATKKCDLFLGLITPQYGSGKEEEGLSFTHQELLKAIELNKPRWLLAHDHVVFSRSLLNHLGYEGQKGRKMLKLKKNPIIDDSGSSTCMKMPFFRKSRFGNGRETGCKNTVLPMTPPSLPRPSFRATRRLRHSSRRTSAILPASPKRSKTSEAAHET